MELWIRSQDKKRLKKVHSTIYLDLPMSNEIIADDVCVGEYKKERALEVLDEIQTHIAAYDYQHRKESTEYLKYESCIYEMPEE